MSENLDLVRSIYADWARGDFTAMDWAHPEIEYVLVDFVEPVRAIGREATADVIQGIFGDWDEPRIETDELRPLPDGRILVLNHLAGRAKKSGIDVSQMHRNGAAILSLKDGMVITYRSYFDRDRA